MAQTPRLLASLGLAVASLAVTVLVASALLALYVRGRGGDVADELMIDPRPSMWQRDEYTGYRNRGHLDRRAFAGLRGRTNAEGFRSEVELTPEPAPGRTRIFGIGDSVTWGIRVDREEAFLGRLEERLGERGEAVEVVNAGVVGYSTLQELRFLEHHAARYAPDVVLVNYCDNDWLPSEDPFATAPRVYQPWLESLATERRSELGEGEAAILPSLRADLHRSFRTLIRDPTTRPALRRILLELPMLDMARFARAHRMRLVYLFIPCRFWPPADAETRAALHALLRDAGVEVVDLAPDLGEVPPKQRRRGETAGLAERMLAASGIAPVFAAIGLGALDPVRALDRFARLRTLERVHEEETFVDDKGHPSRRGHRIIADRVADVLFPTGAGSPPRP